MTDTNFKELVARCRSYRRFYQEHSIDEQTLKELVGYARLSASAANLQPLKYILSFEPLKNNIVFPALSWAGYLKDWGGPEEGERPAAYIIILGDRAISKWLEYDCGICAHAIILGAVEKGLGGCIVASINRDLLMKNLNIPKQYEILLIIALGKPKEKVVIDDFKGDVKYYRDNDQTHHVPKRPLDDIILNL